jgi:peptidoglycan hydrolase-like protein with peptidoglycan-binding domain
MQISRILEKGATGSDVRFVAEQLASLGYPTGKDDQSFGADLEKSIKEFQEDYGLPSDGRVSAETASAIRQAIEELMPGSVRVDRQMRKQIATLNARLNTELDELHALMARAQGRELKRPFRQFTLTRAAYNKIEMKFDPGVEVDASSLASVVPDVSTIGYISAREVDPNDPAAGVVSGITQSINSKLRPREGNAVCYIDPPGICEPCSVVIVIVVAR